MTDFQLPDFGDCATLAAKLDAMDAFIRKNSPDLMDAVDAFIGELNDARVGARAPKVGQPLPEFLLPDDKGGLASLSDYVARGPLIISFFRGRWCPFCVATKDAHDAMQSEAARAGVKLVGITPEQPGYFADEVNGAAIDILCDVDNGYALSLNLLVHLSSDIATVYKELGIDPSAHQVGESWFIPLSASFLVGRDSVVRARHIDPDWRNRLPLEDFVRAAKDL